MFHVTLKKETRASPWGRSWDCSPLRHKHFLQLTGGRGHQLWAHHSGSPEGCAVPRSFSPTTCSLTCAQAMNDCPSSRNSGSHGMQTACYSSEDKARYSRPRQDSRYAGLSDSLLQLPPVLARGKAAAQDAASDVEGFKHLEMPWAHLRGNRLNQVAAFEAVGFPAAAAAHFMAHVTAIRFQLGRSPTVAAWLAHCRLQGCSTSSTSLSSQSLNQLLGLEQRCPLVAPM